MASSRVTVIVELEVPFAGSVADVSVIVDLPGEVVEVTGPALKLTPTVPTLKFDCVASTAV